MDAAFIELAAECGCDQARGEGDEDRTGCEQKQPEQAQP